MDRRHTIVALAALVGSAPFGVALAQQGKVWRIGFLIPNRKPASLATHRYGAFLQGMRDLGYIEGKNLVIEWRAADEVYSRLPALAAELVALKPDVLVTTGTIATRAAQKAAHGIPIVALALGDPVGGGLVDSLARPGRDTTGMSMLSNDLGPKWLEIARTLVPKLSKVGVLVNITSPAYRATLEGLWSAARAANVLVFPVDVRSAADFERAFDVAKREAVGALIVQNEPMMSDHSRRLADLAAKARLPMITARREFAEGGCLISYGTNLSKLFRRAATHVDEIFKGAKAGDLPIEQPTDYELLINLKAAKAIGLTIPRDLLLRADKVIT